MNELNKLLSSYFILTSETYKVLLFLGYELYNLDTKNYGSARIVDNKIYVSYNESQIDLIQSIKDLCYNKRFVNDIFHRTLFKLLGLKPFSENTDDYTKYESIIVNLHDYMGIKSSPDFNLQDFSEKFTVKNLPYEFIKTKNGLTIKHKSEKIDLSKDALQWLRDLTSEKIINSYGIAVSELIFMSQEFTIGQVKDILEAYDGPKPLSFNELKLNKYYVIYDMNDSSWNNKRFCKCVPFEGIHSPNLTIGFVINTKNELVQCVKGWTDQMKFIEDKKN